VSAGSNGAKEAVRGFWEARPCGGAHASAEPGSPAYFAEVEAARDRLEPFIPGFADFGRWRGRRVLEVGVGLGTDFVRFARAGADLHGVDLTDAAVALVRERLAQEELQADVRVADAERLPFDDASFDLVYSWGVLHHTPDPPAAIAEVCRLVRPGGEARVMLYGRRSWVALGLWARYGVLGGRPWRSLTDVVGAHMESPGTRAYTDDELRALFAAFSDVRLEHFVTPYDRRVARRLAGVRGGRYGWFVGIRALA